MTNHVSTTTNSAALGERVRKQGPRMPAAQTIARRPRGSSQFPLRLKLLPHKNGKSLGCASTVQKPNMQVWLEGRHLLLGSEASLGLPRRARKRPLLLRFEGFRQPRLSRQAPTFFTSLVYLGLGDHKEPALGLAYVFWRTAVGGQQQVQQLHENSGLLGISTVCGQLENATSASLGYIQSRLVPAW